MIGGGFTGSEIASACRERNIEVTVVPHRSPPFSAYRPQSIGLPAASNGHRGRPGGGSRVSTANCPHRDAKGLLNGLQAHRVRLGNGLPFLASGGAHGRRTPAGCVTPVRVIY
ncbi:hypothetical protein [Actinacidiphila soli]|uniref:hypothetical protein n=1 Tax=Actinacidiphila soli TaxID=2487275 RepID=UPI0038991EB2